MFPWKTKPCQTPNFKNHGPYISIFYGVLSDLLLLLVVSTLHCEIYRSIFSIVIVMVVALLLSKENCNPGRSQDSQVPGWPREWNKKVVEFPMPLPQLTVHCHCHCHCQKCGSAVRQWMGGPWYINPLWRHTGNASQRNQTKVSASSSSHPHKSLLWGIKTKLKVWVDSSRTLVLGGYCGGFVAVQEQKEHQRRQG